MSTTSLVAARDPDWDQVANIKDAATRLAQIQRTQGATKAFAFIDACYRTHSLSSAYTKAFEACIAQDYMETQILTLIYSRMEPEDLKRMGLRRRQMLATTMSRRVGAAFAPVQDSARAHRRVQARGRRAWLPAVLQDAVSRRQAATPATQSSTQPARRRARPGQPR